MLITTSNRDVLSFIGLTNLFANNVAKQNKKHTYTDGRICDVKSGPVMATPVDVEKIRHFSQLQSANEIAKGTRKYQRWSKSCKLMQVGQFWIMYKINTRVADVTRMKKGNRKLLLAKSPKATPLL